MHFSKKINVYHEWHQCCLCFLFCFVLFYILLICEWAIYSQHYGKGVVAYDVQAHLQLGRTPAGRGGTSAAPRTGRPDWLLRRAQTLGPAELRGPDGASGVAARD